MMALLSKLTLTLPFPSMQDTKTAPPCTWSVRREGNGTQRCESQSQRSGRIVQLRIEEISGCVDGEVCVHPRRIIIADTHTEQ